ncbi:MAG TPA: serine/threonine-protein kinase [Terriglobales bacterium]|nr:serine/threonine-protein kinase [Terriglobales bacterium]
MAHDRIGPFAILAELAAWEGGSVYKAADLKGRTVALRTMRMDAPAAQQNAEAFRAAARAASALDSPNIASVLGGGEASGLFYVALEFVEGVKLSKSLEKGEPLTLSEVTDLSRQICSGLDHAQSKGVVHPELRPGNIVLEWDGTAKIMDFGFPRRHTGNELSEALFYISPEEARGEPLTLRSNVFSWGAMLYQMVTGWKPFAGDTAAEVRRKIMEENPPAPHEVDKDVHPNISWIVMKALAKAPADRYATGADLVRDLENYRHLQIAPAEPAPEPPAPPAKPAAPAPAKPAAPAPAPPRETTFMYAPPAPPPAPPPKVFPKPEAPAAPAPAKPEAPPAAPPAPLAPAPPAAAAPPPAAAPPKAERATPKAAPQAVAPKPPAAAKPKAPESGPSNKLIYMMGGAIGLLVIITVVLAVMLRRPAPEQEAAAAAPAPAASLAKPEPATPATEPEPATPEPRTAAARAKAKQPPPAPAAPVIVTGDVSIDSNPPGAEILIDGKAAGVTPHTASLNAGSHTITISKAGHTAVTRTIEVSAGQKATVAVGLTELAATLSVSSDPAGAAILLDGKATGKVTPAQLIVAKGSHAITVRKQGYRDASETMQLSPGQSAQFAPTLSLTGSTENIKVVGRFGGIFGGKPEDSGRVTVRTNPKGAQVTVNGQALGKNTPVDFYLNPGTYEIVVSREGYKPVKKLVTVEKGGKHVVDETLAK